MLIMKTRYWWCLREENPIIYENNLIILYYCIYQINGIVIFPPANYTNKRMCIHTLFLMQILTRSVTSYMDMYGIRHRSRQENQNECNERYILTKATAKLSYLWRCNCHIQSVFKQILYTYTHTFFLQFSNIPVSSF